MEIQSDTQVDTSALMRCYVLLGLGLPMTFVPLGFISGIAMLFMLIGCVWAYRLRAREDILFKNHGRWMVRTFWISSAYFMLAIGASTAIVSANADRTSIEHMAEAMQTGTSAPAEIAMMVSKFQEDNHMLILLSTIFCFALPVVHAVWRFAKGYCLADKGTEVPNIKTWLV